MAKIKFKNGRVEDYTIVLSTRDKRHLGQLYGLKSITYSSNMNSANEMSFTVYKNDLVESSDKGYDEKIEKYREYLWNNIVDFKLIWVKELEEYFEIHVSLDDSNDIYKSITATSLCESELSQTMLYNFEINSETEQNTKILVDDDYKRTTFYNDEDHDTSLLHRVLQRVPHYKIKHVDKSLCNIQRTFSINGTSVYDFLVGECSEQFDCLFKFDSTDRSISVYDLYTVCNDCGERGEFYNSCPKCNSKNLKYYGEDTTIYIDKNNLTDSIKLEMNSDSIKNCFKLEAGDELITDTVRALNQNGSDRIYINYASDLNKICNDCGEHGEFGDVCSKCGSINWDYTNWQIKDMPKELVEKLVSYDNLYNSYTEEYEQLVLEDYNLTDKISYYTSSMMPKVKHLSNIDYETEEDLINIEDPREGIIYIWNDTVYLYDGENFIPQYEDDAFYKSLIESFVDAKTEANKLTEANLSPIGLESLTTSTSFSTVNNAIKNYAKTFVKTGYVKIDIAKKEDGEYDATFIKNTEINEDGKQEVVKDENGWHYGVWKGRLQVTNYSDEEDIAYTGELTIKVYDNYKEFQTQKIEKNLKSNDDKDNSVFDVLSIDELEDFKNALKLYSHNRLNSFYDALDGATTLLQELEQSEEGADLYDMYLSYQEKKCAIRRDNEEDEFGEDDLRQAQIAELESKRNETRNRMKQIQSELDFEKYLGDLYLIFCAYKREDIYSNSNYISDGLNNNNTKIIDKAKEFLEVAKKELVKSSEQQYTLSSTLYNLLVMEEFKDIVDYFELGNWIRVRVDGVLYRLRLINYTINFDSIQTINVEFSTLTKVKDVMSDVQSILSSAKSMATSYGSVSKQSENGQEANNSLNSIVQNGLDSGIVQIKNNNNEEVTYGKHGILLREYDDIMEDYDDKQCRLTHNAMIYTTDGWDTASLAIGEHKYTYYDTDKKDFKISMDYGVTSKFVQAGYIYGSQIIAGNIYSRNYNYANNEGSHFNLDNGHFNLGKNFVWNGTDLNIDGNGTFTGTINAKDGYFEKGYIGSDEYPFNKWTIGNDSERAYIYNGTSSMTSDAIGTYLGTDGFRNYQSPTAYTNISNGVLDCVGGKFQGAITAGTINIGNNFSVDEYGNVKATDAILNNVTANSGSFTGTITAENGTIGGWTIGTDTLTGGNVTLNSSGALSGTKWSISADGQATFDKFYANSSGQIAGWTINGNTISKGSTSLSASSTETDGLITTSNITINDGKIKVTGNGGWMALGFGTDHLSVSGLNVSSGNGISFRKNLSSIDSTGTAIGSLAPDGSYILLRGGYVDSNEQYGVVVGRDTTGSRISISPDLNNITLRSGGVIHLRTGSDSGVGSSSSATNGLAIYSNKEGKYKVGLTGYLQLGNEFGTFYALFVNGLLVDTSTEKSTFSKTYGSLITQS